MKNIAFLVVLFFIFSSCNQHLKPNPEENDGQTPLLGTWHLVATLVDPGNGSGSFKTVDSDKTLTFQKNGLVLSNGNLCLFSLESEISTQGHYDTKKQTISSDACTNTPFPIYYELNKNELIVSYPCFEPCQAKYIKR